MTDQSGERKFLHDIASPIGTGLFMSELMLEQISQEPGVDPELVNQLKRVYETFDKLRHMIQDRRTTLIEAAKKQIAA